MGGSMKQLSKAIKRGNAATATDLNTSLTALSSVQAPDDCHAHGPMLGLQQTQVQATRRTHLNQELIAEFLEETFNGHSQPPVSCRRSASLFGILEMKGYPITDIVLVIIVVSLLSVIYLMLATRNLVPAPRRLKTVEAAPITLGYSQ